MSYLDDFERSFMTHTLKILTTYEGEYDATLLVNCLLGLLVVPKESFLEAIPETPLSELSLWGIERQSILHPGNPYRGNQNPETLRGLVISLRHAIAHFRITPIPKNGEVEAFEFSNERGLHAKISLSEMREFTKRLATYLEHQ